MADVFDQLPDAPTPPGGGGDVFDKLPAMKPKGDVFDQIGAPQAASSGPENFGAVHNAINAGLSGIDSLANLGIRGLSSAGIVSPERADAAMAVHPFPYDPSRLSAKVGAPVGNILPAALAPELAPALFTAEGGENAIENVTQQVANGRNVSTRGAITNVAGNAALQGAMGLIAPGGAVSESLVGATPALENGLLNAGKNALVTGAVGFPEGAAAQVGGNAINRYSGVNPDQGLGQGALEAGLTNAIGAGVGKGAHDVFDQITAPKGEAAPPQQQENRKTVGDWLGGRGAEKHLSPEVLALPVRVSTQFPDSGGGEYAGGIGIDPSIPEHLRAPLIAHEAAHAEQDRQGKLDYDDGENLGRKHPNEIEADKLGDLVHGGSDWKQQLEDHWNKLHPDFAEEEEEEEAQEEPQEQAAGRNQLAEMRAKMLAAGYNPDAAVPEHGVGEPPPRSSETAEPPVETPGFESPKDVHMTPADMQMGSDLFKKLRDVQTEQRAGQDRRVEENPVPPAEEQRTGSRRFGEGATFETPEEAQRPTLQTARTQQAANEEGTNPGLLQRLLSEEHGGTTALHEFAQQDVIPAAKAAAEKGVKTLTDIDRAMHGGFTETETGKNTALNVRQSLGEAENAGHKFEAAVAPYREHVPSFSKNKGSAMQWADQVEAGGDGGIPEAAPVAELIRQKRAENEQRAKALGIKNLDEEGLGLSRMFEFPDKGNGKGGSIAGTNAPFFRTKYNTFSDALKAAEASGGKAKFDNPVDMQIARQYEVEKNLAARENLRAAEKAGSAEWVAQGDKPTDENAVKLNDPIIGSEERQMALPKWMVGRFSKLEGFEATQFLKDHADDMVPIPPGEKPPQGYAMTPHTERGTFHMDSEAAEKYNNLLPSQPGDPLWKFAHNAARAGVILRYAGNFAHAANAILGGISRQFANGIGRTMHGEFGEAAQSFQDMLTGGYLKGRNLRKSLEAGTAGEVGERAMAVNPDFKLKSVTDKSWLHEAKEKWDNKNPLGATTVAVKGALESVFHGTTFRQILPNILAGHAGTVAENQINRGIPAASGRADMANEVDTLSQLIGHHLSSPNYQRNISRDIASAIIPAARFWEGQARAAGSAFRGNKASMAFFASGTAITAAIGASIQAALTYKNTGKADLPTSLRDCLNPRTGNKDQDGKDERINLPGPISKAYRLLTEPGVELKASLHPAIQGTIDTVRNRDYLGNQVRPDDASTASNIARGAWHIGKGALPMQTPDIYEGPGAKPQDATDFGLGMFGMRRSHPVTSDAQQAAYDILDKANGGEGRDLAAQKVHNDTKSWVQALSSGDRDTAIAGMKADGISVAKAKSIFRIAAEQQEFGKGLPSLLLDNKFKPEDLATIYSKATDEEKPALQKSINYRIKNARPNEGDVAAWKSLQELIK